MSFTLTRENALRLAQVAVVANKDDGRPLLEHVQLTFSKGVLTAIATDSYRLVVYSITDSKAHETELDITVQVPAKEFSEVIKNTLKMASKDHKGQGVTLIPDNSYHQQVDVNGDWPNGPESTVIDETGGSKFPNITSLFGDQPIDGRLRYDFTMYDDIGEGTTLPAFRAGFMADIDKLSGTTVALKKGMMPWQMTWVGNTGNKPERGGWKPWAWSTKSKDNSLGITYLLMPVSPKYREKV